METTRRDFIKSLFAAIIGWIVPKGEKLQEIAFSVPVEYEFNMDILRSGKRFIGTAKVAEMTQPRCWDDTACSLGDCAGCTLDVTRYFVSDYIARWDSAAWDALDESQRAS